MYNRRNVLATLLAGCLCGALIFCFYIVQSLPQFNQYNILKSYQSNRRNSLPFSVRTILLWNTFFDDRRWGLPDDKLGTEYFREQQCRISNCEISNDKNFLPSIDMYDAILFHAAQAFALINSVPNVREPRQLYVFALMEPPGETKHDLSNEGDFYNLTMTYRLDSDIVWPYKHISDIQTGAFVAPNKSPVWRKPPEQYFDEEIDKLMKKRTKMVAWTVSHCPTISQRERLAKDLQKLISVDIFGKCGNMTCKHNSSDCNNYLKGNYKFFFSFENSLCTDYVTEKLYFPLEHQLIPVVLGGADYNRFLPPHSYVDAEKFDSIVELAKYLKYLDEHPKEYMRYFWWRKYYKLADRSPFCDLCEYLHSPSARERTQVYRDIQAWWLLDACYFTPKIFKN